jgi:hypothetical protein
LSNQQRLLLSSTKPWQSKLFSTSTRAHS